METQPTAASRDRPLRSLSLSPRGFWRAAVDRYHPVCFAVVPAKESDPTKVEHLFSSGHLGTGGCRWYAFGSEEDQKRFLLDHPTARSCINPA